MPDEASDLLRKYRGVLARCAVGVVPLSTSSQLRIDLMSSISLMSTACDVDPFLQSLLEHAWKEHRDDFPDIKNIDEFELFVNDIIANPTQSDFLPNSGKTIYWHEFSETLVIKHPRSLRHKGTVYKPANKFEGYLQVKNAG